MDKDTSANVFRAHHILSAGLGILPERMKEAHSYLVGCSDISGYERFFEALKESLYSVKGGDFSNVTTTQFQAAVSAIEEMAYEICRSQNVK